MALLIGVASLDLAAAQGHEMVQIVIDNHEPREMDKFTTLTAVAAPLNMINVDTDMIIPKDYLKTIKRTGLGTGLFSEMRYHDDGSESIGWGR
jgi:hypothetical protein